MSTSSLISGRVLITLMYAILGLVSPFIEGSHAFMILGAVVADMFMLLLVNAIYNLHPKRRGLEYIPAVNGIAALVGGIVILSVFMICGALMSRAVDGTDLEDINQLFADNLFGMAVVMAISGFAYWMEVNTFPNTTKGREMLFGLIFRRMLMIIAFLAVVLFSFMALLSDSASVYLVVLFVLRAGFEWFSKRVWNRSVQQDSEAQA